MIGISIFIIFFVTVGSQPNLQFSKENMRAIIMWNVVRMIPMDQTVREMTGTFGNQSFTEQHIRRLYREYESGRRTSCERQTGSGRPPSANNEEIHERIEQLFEATREWTQTELAFELNISQSSVSRALNELGYHRVASRYVPYQMTCQVRAQRVRIVQQLYQTFENDRRFFERTIAIDEMIIRNYQPLDSNTAMEYRRPDERR